MGRVEKQMKGTLCPLLHRTPHLPGATGEGLGKPEVPTLSLGSCLMGRVAPKHAAPQQHLRKMRQVDPLLPGGLGSHVETLGGLRDPQKKCRCGLPQP